MLWVGSVRCLGGVAEVCSSVVACCGSIVSSCVVSGSVLSGAPEMVSFGQTMCHCALVA